MGGGGDGDDGVRGRSYVAPAVARGRGKRTRGGGNWDEARYPPYSQQEGEGQKERGRNTREEEMKRGRFSRKKNPPGRDATNDRRKLPGCRSRRHPRRSCRCCRCCRYYYCCCCCCWPLPLPRRSLTRSPLRCRDWRRTPSLAVQSRFRSFAGNPRERRSHGYCRIRQGEATAPSRAHPRSPPVFPRCRRHPRRTLSCLRAHPTAENVNILSRAAPATRPLLATTHPLLSVAARSAAPVRPTIRALRMPLPSPSSPANPFAQLHLDPLPLSLRSPSS